MADYEEIRKLYAKTLVEVTSNASRWTSFLRTAARISPYSFVEQILIYAQRPKATACADYNLWHTRMRRQVKRGTKGIAVPDGRGKLKYLFDVSDTVELPGAFSPQLWEMKPEFSMQIAKKLAQKYQLYGSADTIREVIFDITTKQSAALWRKYGQSIINNARTADQTVPEMTLENTYCNFVSESLRYAALSRCEPDGDYDFSLDDMYFELIDRYGMVSAIGSGIQESMKQLFNDIKNEVKVLEEAQERSKDGLLRTEKEFLEEWHPDVLEEFEKNGTLEKYLESIDQTADAMRERLIEQITARDKDEIPDKELEPLKWARVMQGIAMEADSIVMRELILTL